MGKMTDLRETRVYSRVSDHPSDTKYPSSGTFSGRGRSMPRVVAQNVCFIRRRITVGCFWTPSKHSDPSVGYLGICCTALCSQTSSAGATSPSTFVLCIDALNMSWLYHYVKLPASSCHHRIIMYVKCFCLQGLIFQSQCLEQHMS